MRTRIWSLVLWFLTLVVMALVVEPVVRIVAAVETAWRPVVHILTMPLRVLKHPRSMSLAAFTRLWRSATPVLAKFARATSGAYARSVNILTGRPAASANTYMMITSSITQAK